MRWNRAGTSQRTQGKWPSSARILSISPALKPTCSHEHRCRATDVNQAVSIRWRLGLLEAQQVRQDESTALD
jgi:hypothetical protein